ncbi:hypothetical protein L1987_55824 [Smallanthus sonchifolius]|uniref:Uncharacterized protein n=1 Tax=Smallanthus sonchifolius TaxID=185202 RepID=A0ACB9EC49_9ASTR|nr:hypothetical protein L1987_55824 [Smallanthus sonchifolius]
MKKRHMLPATAVLKEGTLLTSLFHLVAEFCKMDSFTTACEIDTRLWSPGTCYACYLVYKLPEKHSLVSGLLQINHKPLDVQNYSSFDHPRLPRYTHRGRYEQYVDLLTPTHIPFIGCNVNDQSWRIKGQPKLRKDGWMEVQILDFKYDRSQFRSPSIPMDCRVRNYHKWKFTGLLVQGIEFRPAKVFFNKPDA